MFGINHDSLLCIVPKVHSQLSVGFKCNWWVRLGCVNCSGANQNFSPTVVTIADFLSCLDHTTYLLPSFDKIVFRN